MPWYSILQEGFKNHSCRYVIQHYLGQFFEEKLSLDQLTVDLYNGIGSVSNVTLNVQALNELGEQHNLPVEFVDGYVSKIIIGIPWSSLFKNCSFIKLEGLDLVIQPKQRADCATSMFESVWSSMTSSIQLAEECLKQTTESISNSEQYERGVVEFAKAIDTLLARVKVEFINTTIRLEHLPKEMSHGAAVLIHIKQFSYSDEINSESLEDLPTKPASAYSVKIFSFDGVDFYSNEFCASHRTICRSLLVESSATIERQSKLKDNDLILFAKFVSKQELRLKIKQKENVSGPKFDIEFNLSSLVTYLSPRQLRTVCEVLCGLMSPHMQDTSNVSSKSRINAKPMTTSDFERVEQELNHHMSPSNLNNFVSKSLQNAAGWSSSGGLEDESDDDFHPVAGHSTTSSVSNSISSSCNSTASSYHFSSKTSESYSLPSQSGFHCHQHTRLKEKNATSEPDFNGEINSFQIRLNFLAIILLHQDILQTSINSQIPEEASVKKMKSLSESFFSQFISLSTSFNGRNDFKNGRQSLQNSVDRNHFRFYCTTLVANGEEKSNSSNFELHGVMTVANMELVECLFEMEGKKKQVVDLLCFNGRSDSNELSIYSQPDFVLQLKQLKDLKHFSVPNRVEFKVNMQECQTEVDVTMIDRLTHVLENLNELFKVFEKHPNNSNKNILNDVHAPVVDMKMQWKISSPLMIVKLRFPVPDLRTECDDCDSFWYKREIYNDILFIELADVSTQSRESNHQLAHSFELQCKSVRIIFQEANCDKPIPFLFSGIDEKFGQSLPNAEQGFDWPRIVLRLYPKIGYIELEDEEDEKFDHNAPGHMFQSIINTQKETSPFSSKMIMRESNTAHTKKASSDNDGEEIILPGTKEEIGEFIEGASRNALIQLNVTLPAITVQLPSKHLYEVIYNRFNNDLMLWTPKSWKVRSKVSQPGYTGPNYNFNFNPSGSLITSFSLCKSTVKNNGDSDDEDGQCENLLFGTETNSINSKKKKLSQQRQQQSNIAVSLFASQGVLDVLPHARDSSGKVIPGQFGEIQILFQEADLFFVSGYKSEPLLNYICLQINHIGLHHSGLISAGSEISLKSVDSYPSQHLNPTLYKTHPDAVINENAKPVGIGSANSDDMLILAVRAQGQENRLKNICVANSLNGVTVRHRMKASYTSWLSQLMNFFDVVDYPILHYQPWKVVTQLHQQFVNCVIDYRPLHLPLRAALTVENFNISSNITTKTSTSILRLIAEEGSLFISKKVDTPNDVAHDLTLNLRKDYVCVIEMGLFELSLRLTDGGDGPQTDLRASNNVVRIRTCADSAVALMDLVKYIACDGDFHDGFNKEFPSTTTKNSNEKMLVTLEESEKEDEMGSTEFRFSHGSLDGSSMKKEVPHLVEEAMNDMTVILPAKKRYEENASCNVQVGEMSESDATDDDIEKGFCILDDAEVGIGYLGKSNVPEVRLLTKEPIKMVDNHFTVPVGKEDVLKAPKNYPAPVSKYTLREMSIVWHMYGGSDFTSEVEMTDTKDTKKHVTIHADSETSLHSPSSSSDACYSYRKSSIDVNNVTFSAGRSCETPTVNFMIPRSSSRVSFSESLNENPNVLYDKHQNSRWQAQGGPNRDHESLMELKLTKVKYQYEIYPKTTKQASRQVLLVQEVEIRDCMATSQINKFLYQYSSSSRPKQSNAYMVMIKATNIRPEQNITNLQECCLRVSLLPLRLNIDQDSLLFLIKFFGDVAGNSNGEDTSATPAKSSPPVMNIEYLKVGEPSARMVEVDHKASTAMPESAKSPLFIRSFVFSPEVPIRLDYEGKRVDLKRGPLAGLIMGLGQLNCSELKLKRIYHRYGFLGLEKLLSFVFTEWLQDIKKNQLPSILGGVGPIYSLVQLFQGIRDLFWLPIEQYQKDGRIVRGLQRGANSFTTSSAMAVLEITARLVYAIQRIAETAFDIVSPGPSIKHVRLYDHSEKHKNEVRAHRYHKYGQPADLREGLASALQLVKDGIGETAQTLVRVASVEHEVKGKVGAVGAVLREMPSTAIRPIIIVSRASGNVLGGVRSQLVPDAHTEAALKWRSDYF